MAKTIISASADADMSDVITYLADNASNRTAAKYVALFDALYDRLSIHPESGPTRPALGPETRIGIVAPFIVIYDYTADENMVTILRILHSKRDIPTSI